MSGVSLRNKVLLLNMLASKISQTLFTILNEFYYYFGIRTVIVTDSELNLLLEEY